MVRCMHSIQFPTYRQEGVQRNFHISVGKMRMQWSKRHAAAAAAAYN